MVDNDERCRCSNEILILGMLSSVSMIKCEDGIGLGPKGSVLLTVSRYSASSVTWLGAQHL